MRKFRYPTAVLWLLTYYAFTEDARRRTSPVFVSVRSKRRVEEVVSVVMAIDASLGVITGALT